MKQQNNSTVSLAQICDLNNTQMRSALCSIALDSELHTKARDILYSWLQHTGNVVVWQLLIILLNEAKSSCREELLNSIGTLPSCIKCLYPPKLQHIASMIHSLPPDGNTLQHIEAAVSRCSSSIEGNSGDFVEDTWYMETWKILLDAQDLLKLCIEQAVPVFDTLKSAMENKNIPQEMLPGSIGRNEDDRMSDTSSDSGDGFAGLVAPLVTKTLPAMPPAVYNQDSNISTTPSAALEYIAWILWPHDAQYRNALKEALLAATKQDRPAIPSTPFLTLCCDAFDVWKDIIITMG